MTHHNHIDRRVSECLETMAKGGYVSADGLMNNGSVEAAMTFLIADLMHLAGTIDVPFQRIVQKAFQIWRDEVETADDSITIHD